MLAGCRCLCVCVYVEKGRPSACSHKRVSKGNRIIQTHTLSTFSQAHFSFFLAPDFSVYTIVLMLFRCVHTIPVSCVSVSFNKLILWALNINAHTKSAHFVNFEFNCRHLLAHTKPAIKDDWKFSVRLTKNETFHQRNRMAWKIRECCARIGATDIYNRMRNKCCCRTLDTFDVCVFCGVFRSMHISASIRYFKWFRHEKIIRRMAEREPELLERSWNDKKQPTNQNIRFSFGIPYIKDSPWFYL